MAISMTQPMRPAEIDLVKQVNQNTTGVAANKTSISNEVIDRKNAIDAEANARTRADNSLQANIGAETAAREASDARLQRSITDEQARAEKAESTLATNIDNEAARAKEAEKANSTAISAEATARTDADNALQANIDAETAAREASDARLQRSITDEQARAEKAESTLATNIGNEAARAKEAEKANSTAISAEATARTDADNALQANIDAVNAKFPVQADDIGDSQVDTSKIASKAVTNDKLSDALQTQAEFLTHVPSMEFGTSDTVDVPANSNTRIDISFSAAKTEAPIVICGLQHDTGNLNCIVTGVTNQQFSVTVYNLASTDVTGVTIDWLAISGR